MYASRSAQLQALSTLEILELILLQLDMRTLLTSAQRVCRLWADLIKKSLYIQEALFLAPVRDNNTNAVAVDKVRNPLLVEAFPSIFQNTNTTSAYEEEENDVFTLTSFDMILNPEKKEAYLRPGASWRHMLVQQPPIPKIAIFQVFYGMSIGYRYYEIPVSALIDNNMSVTLSNREGILMLIAICGKRETRETCKTVYAWTCCSKCFSSTSISI